MTCPVLDELTAAGVELYLDGDRLRFRAPPGVMTEARRAQVAAHRAALIAVLMAAPLSTLAPALTPREHLYSLANKNPARGVIGIIGSEAAGRLWLAVQAWESARDRFRPEAIDLEGAYWKAWAEIAPGVTTAEGSAP
jgi:hypothetical protein